MSDLGSAEETTGRAPQEADQQDDAGPSRNPVDQVHTTEQSIYPGEARIVATFEPAPFAFFEVPEDGTYLRDDGSPFLFTRWHQMSYGAAMSFPAFREMRESSAEERTMSGAPENWMEPSSTIRSRRGR